jgi:hypothetical protein
VTHSLNFVVDLEDGLGVSARDAWWGLEDPPRWSGDGGRSGDFVVGAGQADLESLDFAEPSFAFGLGDPGDEVVADVSDTLPLQSRSEATDPPGGYPLAAIDAR